MYVLVLLLALTPVLLFFGALIRVMCIEHRIKKLYRLMERDSDAERGQGRGRTLDLVNRKIEKIEGGYKLEIERLERDRRYILDKLPFLRR